MTALSADAPRQMKVANQRLHTHPVASATTIYKGGLVCLDATGYAIPAADTAGISNVIGVATEKIVNSGADGAKDIEIASNVDVLMDATSITQAMLGTTMYVVTDNDIDDAAGATNERAAGTLIEFVSSTSGWILIPTGGIFSDLADLSVETEDIVALAVTTAKIAADAVDGTKIADLAVDTEHLAADAVTGAKIEDNAVDSEHYAALSIDSEHFAVGSVNADALDLSDFVTLTHVAHSDSSPVTILAADGVKNRTVSIVLSVTEDMAGTPEFDIGEEDTVNKFMDDVGGGVSEQGESFVAVGTLLATKALICTIVSAGSAGEFDLVVTIGA